MFNRDKSHDVFHMNFIGRFERKELPEKNEKTYLTDHNFETL